MRLDFATHSSIVSTPEIGSIWHINEIKLVHKQKMQDFIHLTPSMLYHGKLQRSGKRQIIISIGRKFAADLWFFISFIFIVLLLFFLDFFKVENNSMFKSIYSTLCLACVVVVISAQAFADVLSAGVHGFVIEITGKVDVEPSAAYDQFLRVNEWWDGDHSWFGSADNFYIEPKVGGCFCEINGEQQAQHMQISFVNPGREIRMLGGLGPLQMMGLHGAMSWKFEKN